MAEIKVETVHGPVRREILKGLRAFNTRAIGKFEFKPLSVTLRHRGAIVGALYGETYLNWMYISLFWLADESSRQRVRVEDHASGRKGSPRARCQE